MTGLTRRDLLLSGAAAATGVLAAGAGPARAARAKFDGTIRVLGLGYDLPSQIRKQAQQDLGFAISSTSGSPGDIQRLVTQEPATWDIFSCFQQDVAEFWPTGNLRPVEIARIRRWKGITPLYKLGRARPERTRCAYGKGDAAFRRLYVDPNRSGRWSSAPGVPASVKRELVQWVNESTGKPAGPEPKFCTGAPGTFNFDSFAYNSGVLKKQPEVLSWAELLNGRWKGHVGLNGFDSQSGLQDMANAVQAAGLMRFVDLGDPTRKEIDNLVKLLLSYRKRGQFFNIWPQGGDQVEWMLNKKVVLCTMYASQIASLSAVGFPVRQADPPEGYRAFGGLLSISAAVTDPAQLDACYAFLNWWHSGFPGAVLLRAGYYNAVPSTIRQHMTPGEYAYWMDGQAADQTYSGPSGDPSVAKGRHRDGGSFINRACRISSWNSTPRQQDYFLGRWAEFIASFSQPGR